MKTGNKNIRRLILVFAGAFFCCFLWGSAFPVIKIGYDKWNIDSADTWSIICFAGIRFFLAGVMVILIASIKRRKLLIPRMDELPAIMLLSLFQTIGQYIFFYLGLANTKGVNAAVINSLSTFFAILIASLVFRMERLSVLKLVGCAFGFAGVLLININSDGFSINLLGDGLIVLSALCYGMSSSMIKRYSKEHDTVLFSGYQFVFGGLVMTLISLPGSSLLTGAERASEAVNTSEAAVEGQDTFMAVIILLYLALVSCVAYTLWGILLRKEDVSKIAIFGFMTPVFGVVLSAILLGEMDQVSWKYMLALVLVGAGIVIVNKNDVKKVMG